MPSYYIQEELNMKGYPYAYNLSEKRVVNSIENGLLNTIFFITYFIEICKKSLLDTYTDSEQIINFKEKISLVTDKDYLISDLLLELNSYPSL